VIEVRSYRRVFELERRIYSVDRLRLNPGGVPVRGVVYFLALLLGALLGAGLPFVGSPVRAAPWYLRDLFGPGLLAMALTLVRVDGRTFHLAAQAVLRFAIQPRQLDGLRRASTSGELWVPTPITMLPDGSDCQLRRLRYRGPGRVLVTVEHRLSEADEGRRIPRPGRKSLRLSAHDHGAPLESGKVVSLEREVTLSVHPEPEAASR